MVNTVSLQYAKAIFDLAQANTDKINGYHQHLTTIQKSIENDKMFQQVLDHPKISKNEKKDIFQAALGERVDPNVLHFMYVLVDNNRIEILSDVLDAFQYLIDQRNKVKHVTVFSKIDLTDSELEQLKIKLSDKFDSLVELTNVVDQSISGGIRLEYDGYVLDDTLTSKLNRLKEVLKSK